MANTGLHHILMQKMMGVWLKYFWAPERFFVISVLEVELLLVLCSSPLTFILIHLSRCGQILIINSYNWMDFYISVEQRAIITVWK